jgi:hypothetical protein
MSNGSDALAAGDGGGDSVGAPGGGVPAPAVAARSRRKISKLIRLLRCNGCAKEYSQEAIDGEDFQGDDEFCTKKCRLGFKDVDDAHAAASKWGRAEAKRALNDKVRLVASVT